MKSYDCYAVISAFVQTALKQETHAMEFNTTRGMRLNPQSDSMATYCHTLARFNRGREISV